MQLGPTAAHGEAVVVPELLHGFARGLPVSLAISAKFVATLFRLGVMRVQTASVMADLVSFFRARSIGKH